MAVKRQISRLYKFSTKRPYNFVKTKQGKCKIGLSNCRILTFKQGNFKSQTYNTVKLQTQTRVNLLQAAIQSLRVSFNRKLGNNLGRNQYQLTINSYPHNILRHHRLASGANADRVSQGMRLAFGTPLVRCVMFRPNNTILQVRLNKSVSVKQVKFYLAASSKKLPVKTKIWTCTS